MTAELTRAVMQQRLTLALKNADITPAALDARLLLLAALAIDETSLARSPETILTAHEHARAEAFLQQRLAHRPVAKIIGQKEFWGRVFKVTEDVLDPRPDSETLIELALAKMVDDRAQLVLDLGTGSGCLLLTLLAERRAAQGWGIDKSPAALAVAQENAARLDLAGRAQFFCSDWFSKLAENAVPRLDLIIANPPYIKTAELAQLPADVRDYDPPLALDGGPDGMAPYRMIIDAASAYLKKDAWLIFEVGHDQAGPVWGLLRAAGFGDVEVVKDLAGHERVVAARRPAGR